MLSNLLLSRPVRRYLVDRCPPKCDGPTVTGAADTLPDFFPGTHVQLMRRKLAAADRRPFRPYFPKVELKA
jgi:hypothetical protein